MRRTWAVFGVLLVVLAVVAVLVVVRAGGPDSADRGTRADRLWSGRTAYVGSSSAVTALAEDAGFRAAGTYTLALQTAARPYGVTVRYAPPAQVSDLQRSAVLLLGTVANLDRVRVQAGGTDTTWTADQASAQLGYDVKTLGRDRARLDAYAQAAFG